MGTSEGAGRGNGHASGFGLRVTPVVNASANSGSRPSHVGSAAEHAEAAYANHGRLWPRSCPRWARSLCPPTPPPVPGEGNRLPPKARATSVTNKASLEVPICECGGDLHRSRAELRGISPYSGVERQGDRALSGTFSVSVVQSAQIRETVRLIAEAVAGEKPTVLQYVGNTSVHSASG